MQVFVLGGDGFCGWPTALHLAAAGHDVTIVDSLVRRAIDAELGLESLTPIRPLDERVAVWNQLGIGRPLAVELLDIATSPDRLTELVARDRPDTVVHFAEQRAAPYSMKSPAHRRYTIDNNVRATHNVLTALVAARLDTHLVHLGTMGVYGYGTAGVEIPEGYLTVRVPRDDDPVEWEILFPTDPGSVYHMSKSLDQVMFQLYAKNDGLRITDLHQGIVWGTQTSQTRLDDRLINRFDYDGDFGTVLNRFLVQAASGHPLTVHGSGDQSRAFIHLQDTVRAVGLAVDSGHEVGDSVRVMNQVAEVFRVRDLADLVAGLSGARVAPVENPRSEAPANDLVVVNDRLLALGLDPITLRDGLLEEVMEVVRRYADRVDPGKILPRSFWNAEREEACDGALEGTA